MKTSQKPFPVWLVAVAILLAVGFYIVGGPSLVTADDATSPPRAADTSESSSEVAESISSDGSRDSVQPSPEADIQFSGLDATTIDDLPAEAIDTMDLIFAGGPFPFDRDDLVFQNREGLLPDHNRGYYREYTVITPGESDRGARRIVAGADGDLYYTDDHYQSFREIVGIGS